MAYLTGNNFEYPVSNQYGFASVPRIGEDDGDHHFMRTRGHIVNYPSDYTEKGLDYLARTLSKCGVTRFSFDCFVGGELDGASMMEVYRCVYPTVKKYGPGVFSSRETYLMRRHKRDVTLCTRERLGPIATQLDMQYEAQRPLKFDIAEPLLRHAQSLITSTKGNHAMSNENPKFDSQTGARIIPPYESRIINGDELSPGKVYRLEIVGGKNPPEVASAGTIVVALANEYGSYNNWVRLGDGTERTFEVDSTDLFLHN